MRDHLSHFKKKLILTLYLAAALIGCDTALDARALPLIEMPNRHGFLAEPRPEMFK